MEFSATTVSFFQTVDVERSTLVADVARREEKVHDEGREEEPASLEATDKPSSVPSDPKPGELVTTAQKEACCASSPDGHETFIVEASVQILQETVRCNAY